MMKERKSLNKKRRKKPTRLPLKRQKSKLKLLKSNLDQRLTDNLQRNQLKEKILKTIKQLNQIRILSLDQQNLLLKRKKRK